MSRRQTILLALLGVLALAVGWLALRIRQPPLLPGDPAHARFTGEADCLSCHGPGSVVPRGPNHPLGMDCLRCHGPHASDQKSLMTKPLQALCTECHDLKAPSFAKAHFNIAPAGVDCRSCHNPHASKDPKFFQEKVHAPFAARSCEKCHVAEKR